MKRFWIIILAVFLLLTCRAGAEDGNLLPNGGFETPGEDGVPEGWSTVSYREQLGYSYFSCDSTHVHSGEYAALIENAADNDSRLTVTLKVEPDTLYCISGYVWLEDFDGTGNGANIALENIICVSDCVKGDSEDWTRLEWYGVTGPDQRTLTIGIRLGGYGRESAGKAWFDDFSLTRLEELPEGVYADLWYAEETAESSSEAASSSLPQNLFWILLGCLAFVPFVLLLKSVFGRLSGRSSGAIFALLLLVAVILRIVLSVTVPGYSVDINCFTAWSMRIASSGPASFYAEDYFCDYPPGCILLLAPVGFVLNAIGYDSPIALLTLKALPILLDVLSGLLLFWIGLKTRKQKLGMLVSVLYLFSPAVLVTGAAWGQMDSLTAFTLLLALLFAAKKKWRFSLPIYVLSILIKPQALLAGPVGLCWFVLCIFEDYRARLLQWKEYLLGIGFSLLTAAVIVLPFMVGQEKPFAWLLELYGGTLSSYEYATLNTANLYYLAGGNWFSITGTIPLALGLGTAGFLLCAGGSFAIRPGWKGLDLWGRARVLLCLAFGLFALYCGVFGKSYALFGYGMMALVYLYSFLCILRHRDGKQLAFQAGLALCGIYCIAIKVHERYMFSALLLFAVSYLFTQDVRVLIPLTGFSITTAINCGIVLNNSILYGSSMGHLNQDTLAVNLALSLCNLGLLVYSAYLGFSGLKEYHFKQEATRQRVRPELPKTSRFTSPRLNLRPVDFLVMGLTTLAYSVLCFSTLGSTVAPQTAWVSASSQDEVVLELEESQDFKLLYYCGVSYNHFAVEVSEDGESWSQDYACRMSESYCYRWNYLISSSGEGTSLTFNEDQVLTLHGRYIKVKALSPGLNLWEVVARDSDGNNLPLKVVSSYSSRTSGLGEDYLPEHLVDEMDTCVGEPGWYTGTYFDEIYHVRTAYEHLHGQKPYETTHPPLGKLLIACGIAIFGMTPFGWRFMGAFLGALMLPLIYLLAYQITRKRTVAVVSIGGLALDLMHFAQTRLATIDTYPVFFILLSYWMMVRYLQTAYPSLPGKPFFTREYRKGLLRLGLCGVFMGLSIASKWTGIYSAAGLAILYFADLFRRIREADPSQDGETGPWVYLKRPAVTCLFCVAFFLVIPGLIYYASYIPYFAPSGGITLERVIQAQEGMLSYHSQPGLGMDHPFQSPWYEWPLILKPMWYAEDLYEPAGYASTIFCMGNPWVFYLGALAMLMVLGLFLGKLVLGRKLQSPLLAEETNAHALTVLSVGFLVQYLPWVLVPRSMYIYHYFASVPFIIMATGYLLSLLKTPKARWAAVSLYLLGAAALFVIFYPYASGALTSIEYLKWVRSLPALLYRYKHFVLYY